MLYGKVLKFWLNWTFDWEYMCNVRRLFDSSCLKSLRIHLAAISGAWPAFLGVEGAGEVNDGWWRELWDVLFLRDWNDCWEGCLRPPIVPRGILPTPLLLLALCNDNYIQRNSVTYIIKITMVINDNNNNLIPNHVNTFLLIL